MCLDKWCSSIQTFSFLYRAQSFCCCCCCFFYHFFNPPPTFPLNRVFFVFVYPTFFYRGPPTIPPPAAAPLPLAQCIFFTPIFVQYSTLQYSTVTLHNWFSNLDARALQSGLWRFCEFFGGGAGEEDTSVLVHWIFVIFFIYKYILYTCKSWECCMAFMQYI